MRFFSALKSNEHFVTTCFLVFTQRISGLSGGRRDPKRKITLEKEREKELLNCNFQ